MLHLQPDLKSRAMNKLKFSYETEQIELVIQKSKRKSMTIAIQPDGNLLVKAPFFLSDDEIVKWVKTKTGWIIRQRAKILEQQQGSSPKQYAAGEKFLYLGQEYVLDVRLSEGRAGMVGLVEDKIVLFTRTAESAVIQKILNDWYDKQAKTVISKRVRYYAEQMGEIYGRIIIKSQKKRWGSCSSARNLNFNRRLIMAPPEVLDYVVVHELCHLRQMNHSKEFWKEVEVVLPNYKLHKKWLETNGHLLNF